MKPLKLAISSALLFVVLGNGCSSDTHEFMDMGAGSGGTPAAGTGNEPGGSTTKGGSAAGSRPSEAGTSPIDTGGSSNVGGGPTEAAGAGGEPPVVGECESGEQESCWEAEDGTPLAGAQPSVEKGSCHIGKRFCGVDLNWGPCLGAVGAKAKDSCEVAGNDDDCDGVLNGGCACVNGSKRSCGTDVGSCVAGEQTCVAQAWGPCVGEVTKQTLDSCLTDKNDDNCNGLENEGCPCIGSAVRNCNDCGSQECNAAGRQWGACHKAQDTKACGCGTLTCQSDGNWSSCQPAASECISNTQVRDCTGQAWVTTACKFSCLSGACAGVCTPGAKRCVTDPDRVQTCNDQGQWTTAETCANNFACVNNACSNDTCQQGFNGPCGGVCTNGCCAAQDCPDKPNMARSCSGSHQCLYSCKGNWGNCDGSDANGCEVNLIVGTTTGTTVKHCGTCGNTCDFKNPEGGTDCSTFSNKCELTDCIASFVHIGETTDEYAFDLVVERPHATLRRGDCDVGGSYDCEQGQWDCNGYASDGCESSSDTGGCYQDPFWPGTYD